MKVYPTFKRNLIIKDLSLLTTNSSHFQGHLSLKILCCHGCGQKALIYKVKQC